jgi:hypothetical protein
MAKKSKKKKDSLKTQLKENKQLLIGVSVAILMLLVASFGARGDFLRMKKESKPVPDELVKSLSPTPTFIKEVGDKKCIITGCSSQICSDEEITTTCEYKEIYSCYETANCEVQKDGECGWTMDNDLSECLQSFVGEPSL